MSWHGPSAPRVEGIATKSFVTASCASNACIHRVQNSPLIVVNCHRYPRLISL